MKDELGEKITTNFVGLKPKTFSYSMNVYIEEIKWKKIKWKENCPIKQKHKFED